MTTTSASVIYPEQPDPLTPGDLQVLFNPSFDERKWAPSVARTPETQLALLVHLKIFQTIGRFLPAADLAFLSPYATSKLKRFGDYPTDLKPEAMPTCTTLPL